MTGRLPETSTKWPGWKVGGATILTFVALLYLIEIIDQLSGHALDRNGIRPLESDGSFRLRYSSIIRLLSTLYRNDR